MRRKEDMLRQVAENDKYKTKIESVDDEIAAGIQKTIDSFVGEMATGMDEIAEAMKNPETR